jgi:uroporphyrinogen-III synthase
VTQPLAGTSVVVTRARHQVRDFIDLLEAAGATTVECPVIDITSPADGGIGIQRAFENLSTYDWLVVTSANTVDRIDERVRGFNGSVAAIGSGTAEALSDLGVTVDLIPQQFVAESLVDAFPAGSGRVLLPRASVARDVLPDGLRAKGWEVDVVDAYQTVDLTPDKETLAAVSVADVVTFTASSTVSAFVNSGAWAPPLVACIGPVTARTAEENGLKVDVIADEHTIEGLVVALGSEVERRRPQWSGEQQQ